MGSWPLQGVQYVGVFRIPALHTRVSSDARCPIPELKEANRGIPTVVEVADPGADRPVSWPTVEVVLGIGVGVDQVTLPVGERRTVHAVDSVNARRI